MTNSEFIQETTNLEKYYGKELEAYQLHIWFEELKKLKIERYRQIIRQIYKTNKFMPKLADIIEINNNLAYAKKEEIIETEKCDKCNSTGFVTYTQMYDNGTNKIPYTYIAKCICKNGNKFSYYGKNDIKNKSDYYVPSILEIGI